MLYANTDDGSSALWVCDGNGVVVDNISYSLNERAPILEQINEHYGTSFTGWSDNEIGLRLGDTVPNWNAYEKIEIEQIEFVKYKIAINDNFMAGHIDYDTMKLKIWSQANQQALVQFNSAGKWIGGGGDPTWNTDFLNAVIAKGINVVSAEFEDIPNMQPQDTIENWSEYVEV